MTKLLSLLIEW